MRWLKLTLLLLLLGLGLVLLPVRRIADDEMSPNLRRGDLVWVLPLAPLRGDLVVLRDPLDPDQRIVRRTLTGGGTKVSWDESGVRVNSKRVRQSDMGDEDGDAIQEELIWSKPPARERKWRVRQRRPLPVWPQEAVEVPEASWYLLADDRDRALDSRSWGPVPAAELDGVIRLRLGPPDPWRGWISWEEGWE